LRLDTNLSDRKIFAFLHKINLVKPSYLFQKIKAINDFFKLQYHKGQEIEIFKTSITEDFFFDTYNIIGGILSLLFQKDLIPISRNEFQALKKEILIVLKIENSLRYNKEALMNLISHLKFNSCLLR